MARTDSVQSFISYSLATAHRKVHTSLTARLKKFGIQVAAWRVLEIIENDEELTMGDLADLALMNPPTLTKLVDRMVSDGLIHRRISTLDHRKINLSVTVIGHKRMDDIREQAYLEEEQITHKIGEERVNLLKSILSEIGKY